MRRWALLAVLAALLALGFLAYTLLPRRTAPHHLHLPIYRRLPRYTGAPGQVAGGAWAPPAPRVDWWRVFEGNETRLLVAPPSGPDMMGRGEPSVPYPLWGMLRTVNSTSLDKYLGRLVSLVMQDRSVVDVVWLPPAHYIGPWGNITPPPSGEPVRAGSVLLPYGFRLDVLIYPCSHYGDELCALLHLYPWNATGLALLCTWAGFPGQYCKATGRVVWVIHWPVDEEHSARLAYPNGTVVARVARVTLVLEEPLLDAYVPEYQCIPGEVNQVLGYERVHAWKALAWYWDVAGAAGAVAQWLAGNTLHEAVEKLLREWYGSLVHYNDSGSGFSPYWLIRDGGICVAYTAAGADILSGLIGAPSIRIHVPGHASLAMPSSLAVNASTVAHPGGCYLGVCIRYRGRWTVAFDTGALLEYMEGPEWRRLQELKLIHKYVVPAWMVPPDAFTYNLLWALLKRLPWWLESPWMLTPFSRSLEEVIDSNLDALHWSLGYVACLPPCVYPRVPGALNKTIGYLRAAAVYWRAPAPPVVYDAGGGWWRMTPGNVFAKMGWCPKPVLCALYDTPSTSGSLIPYQYGCVS